MTSQPNGPVSAYTPNKSLDSRVNSDGHDYVAAGNPIDGVVCGTDKTGLLPIALSKMPTPGSMLTANIRLERPLARGGMGVVWLADHLGLQTKVVVKFIAQEVSEHPETVARFEREAAAAAQVKNQHVVQMLDHGISVAGLAYIVMELLEGTDLGSYLDLHPKLPACQAAHVIGQMAKALGRAHDNGVIHRDIKPENIFLCDDGQGDAFVKVLDFGIAKMQNGSFVAATQSGSVVGTPYYMSPEQIMGAKDLDHRADLWALAVVAYEMLTGAPPFKGDSMGAISVRICSGQFELPSAVNAALTPAIDAFFTRALSRDLGKRFATARSLADAFEKAAGGAEAMPCKIAERKLPGSLHVGVSKSKRTVSFVGLITTAGHRIKESPLSFAAVALLVATGVLGATYYVARRPAVNSRSQLVDFSVSEHVLSASGVGKFPPSEISRAPRLAQSVEPPATSVSSMVAPKASSELDSDPDKLEEASLGYFWSGFPDIALPKPNPTFAPPAKLPRPELTKKVPAGSASVARSAKSCSPPYYFNDMGRKVPKPECE